MRRITPVATASTAAVAAILLAYHLRVFRRDLRRAAAVPAEAPLPVVAVALVRSPDRARWREFQRDVLARRPAGIEVQLREVDPATADKMWAVGSGQ